MIPLSFVSGPNEVLQRRLILWWFIRVWEAITQRWDAHPKSEPCYFSLKAYALLWPVKYTNMKILRQSHCSDITCTFSTRQNISQGGIASSSFYAESWRNVHLEIHLIRQLDGSFSTSCSSIDHIAMQPGDIYTALTYSQGEGLTVSFLLSLPLRLQWNGLMKQFQHNL